MLPYSVDLSAVGRLQGKNQQPSDGSESLLVIWCDFCSEFLSILTENHGKPPKYMTGFQDLSLSFCFQTLLFLKWGVQKAFQMSDGFIQQSLSIVIYLFSFKLVIFHKPFGLGPQCFKSSESCWTGYLSTQGPAVTLVQHSSAFYFSGSRCCVIKPRL